MATNTGAPLFLVKNESGDKVADSLLTYQNGNMDKLQNGLNERTTATQAGIDYADGYKSQTSGFVRKWGRTVQISLGISGTFDTTERTCGTLSKGYTPTGTIYGSCINLLGTAVGRFTINPLGDVSIRMSSPTNTAFFSVAYVSATYGEG